LNAAIRTARSFMYIGLYRSTSAIRSLTLASLVFFGAAGTTLLPGLQAQAALPAIQPPVPIDFSFAGYEGGGHDLPTIAAVLRVRPSGSDDRALLQAALDKVATMPIQANGFRGALLLAPGSYHLSGQLNIHDDGVVLRGSGEGATTLIATGQSRRTLLDVGREGDYKADPKLDAALSLSHDAPVGSRTLALASVSGLHIGDRVVVRRPSTQPWISALSMSGLPGTFANQRLDWKPGSHDLQWDRVITALDAANNSITLDAPLTAALELKWGGGSVARVVSNAPIAHVGVEELTLESAFNAALAKDEDHAWIAVRLDHVEDAWVRHVTARHFAGSAVRVNSHGRRITLEDCHSQQPVSEEAGYRRQSFLIDGQQVLVHRASSELAMNDFATGLLAAGPNVFLDCTAAHSLGASGAFEGFAAGILYEQVRLTDTKLQLMLDFSRAQGAGWTAANSVVWNSSATSIDVLGPPEAPNYAVQQSGSLYQTQLLARTGQPLRTVDARRLVSRAPEADAELPELSMADLKPEPPQPLAQKELTITNGRFAWNGQAVWGTSQTESWWRGDRSPLTAADATGSSVTRFMPGVVAPGLTEDLPQMVIRLKARGAASIQVNPGLWYDHRRDAHTVEHWNDANAWAPFYEVPWARSGVGTAWDGLSKFDLARYNPYYFERHRAFAQAAAAEGLIVFYDLYNTHNVLEIGPHWIDYAWRPANNINNTGLPEPPPMRASGRSDEANEFYSTTYAPLKALHKAYILHTLDELGSEPNLIFGLAYQYAGPTAFQEFFQDTVQEWEQAHHKKIRIALTTSKRTTDAILAAPARAAQVAVIDMRYWEYLADGSLFAPEAGQNRAFRELIANAFPGYTDAPPATTAEQVYRQVREYRSLYPNKALMPMEAGAGPLPILMAGGALPSALQVRAATRPPTAQEAASGMYPAQAKPTSAQAPQPVAQDDKAAAELVARHLRTSLMKLEPKDGWVDAADHTWVLAGGATDPVLIYSLRGEAIDVKAKLPAAHAKALWLNPHTGEETPAEASGANHWIKPDPSEWLLLLSLEK